MLIPGLPTTSNMWSAILSASNGLTWNRATRSLTWGGSLTANTTIELGSSTLEFIQSGAPVLVTTNGRRIGIRTSSPATQVNTATSTANQTDGTTALGTLGFGYEVAQANYAAAIVNTNNATSSNGALVRIARANADARVLWVGVGTTPNVIAFGDGRTAFGATSASAKVHITETYANGAEVFCADFGIASRGLRYYAGTTNDLMTLEVGDTLRIQRNGASNPIIRAVGLGLTLRGDTGIVISQLSTNAPGTIEFTGDYSLGVPAIGPNNVATSAFAVKNFSAGQMVRFRVENGTQNISDSGVPTSPASAILSLDSTTRGFLPPRMTTAQRDLITSPADGLIIYNTTLGKFQGREAGAWANFI